MAQRFVLVVAVIAAFRGWLAYAEEPSEQPNAKRPCGSAKQQIPEAARGAAQDDPKQKQVRYHCPICPFDQIGDVCWFFCDGHDYVDGSCVFEEFTEHPADCMTTNWPYQYCYQHCFAARASFKERTKYPGHAKKLTKDSMEYRFDDEKADDIFGAATLVTHLKADTGGEKYFAVFKLKLPKWVAKQSKKGERLIAFQIEDTPDKHEAPDSAPTPVTYTDEHEKAAKETHIWMTKYKTEHVVLVLKK